MSPEIILLGVWLILTEVERLEVEDRLEGQEVLLPATGEGNVFRSICLYTGNVCRRRMGHLLPVDLTKGICL